MARLSCFFTTTRQLQGKGQVLTEISDITCLYDGDAMQLLHLPGTSDDSLVTFDIMHARANGRTGFAIKLALKHDLDFYAVVPKQPNWYPASEARACADLIARAKDRPSIGYGASMGGYGVLKYGAAMALDATLAMSPQSTIDPAINGTRDTRYARFFDPALHVDMQIKPGDTSPRAYAVCDPGFGPDALQRDLIGGDVIAVDLHHMGHKAVEAMTPSDNALARLDDARHGRTAALLAALTKSAAQTRPYAVMRATSDLAAGKAENALARLSDARTRFGAEDDLTVMIARACLATGRPADAIADMAALVALKPHQIIYRRLLAQLYEAAGQTRQAIAELSQAVDQSKNPVLGRQLYRMMAAHDHPQRDSFAKIACTLWPDRATQFAS